MKSFSVLALLVTTLLTACFYIPETPEEQRAAMERVSKEWGCYYDEGPGHDYRLMDVVSFRPPLMHFDGRDVVYNSYKARTWELCPSKDGKGVSINQMNNEAPFTGRQVVKLIYRDIPTYTLKPWAEDCGRGPVQDHQGTIGEFAKARKTIPINSTEDILWVFQKNMEIDRACRQEILSGTLEDHWQEKLKHRTIEEMTDNMEVRDEKLDKLVPVKRMDPERKAFYAKRSFFYHFGRKRARYIGLPEDTIRQIEIDGQTCIQLDGYQRLEKPLGQYATTTGGGLGHGRAYHCYIDGAVIKFGAYMEITPGYQVDFDALMQPVLDSIKWLRE
jgi:hypothetical protein